MLKKTTTCQTIQTGYEASFDPTEYPWVLIGKR